MLCLLERRLACVWCTCTPPGGAWRYYLYLWSHISMLLSVPVCHSLISLHTSVSLYIYNSGSIFSFHVSQSVWLYTFTNFLHTLFHHTHAVFLHFHLYFRWEHILTTTYLYLYYDSLACVLLFVTCMFFFSCYISLCMACFSHFYSTHFFIFHHLLKCDLLITFTALSNCSVHLHCTIW